MTEQNETTQAECERVTHFHTKLVGVIYPNGDGSSRQEIISRCQLREQLILEHERGNHADPNAIAVKRQNGQQLGYLPRELAEEVAREREDGCLFTAFVSRLKGGTESRPTRGVDVVIVEAVPDADDGEAQSYVDGAVAPEIGLRAGDLVPPFEKLKTSGAASGSRSRQ